MFDPFFEIISNLLNFFYELIPDYAFAIAMLTLVVMVVTTPLTLKGTRSMIEMQRLQPEIRKLQAQYKDDRQKLNEEMMRFYKERNINPLGGCFPLLIQAPVFSILFWVVQGLTNQSKFVSVQNALADMLPNIRVTDGFRPKYLDQSTELYQALLGDDQMNSFGVDLSRSSAAALSEGFFTALPYIGLVAVIALLSWYQQRQIMGRNPGQEVTSQQRMMMRIGPAMYVFFAFVSPMAIGVYFLVSTVWRVGQQAYITRSLYRGEDAPGVQAQKATADMRNDMAKNGGGGGLLAALRGDSGGSAGGKDSNRQPAKSASKSGARPASKSAAKSTKGTTKSTSKSGGSRPTGKSARPSQNGSGAEGRAPVPAAKPHPRSRKKKKRK